MSTRLKSWLSSPSLVGTVVSNVRVAVRLLREPRVPAIFKAVPLLGLAYVISPLDFIPDVLPVVGQLDDLGMILLAIELFRRLCPRETVAFHETSIAQGRPYSPMMSPPDDYIDAEWRRG